MSEGSPAAAAAITAPHDAATRPIRAPEAITRPHPLSGPPRRRLPLRPLSRQAAGWALQLASLAAYVAAVYLAVAVGLGSLTSWSADWRTGMRLAAVAVTAAGFTAVRRRVAAAVQRLVTPAPGRDEVLASLASQMRAAGPIEDALPSLARLLGEGTEAREAAVWVRSGACLVRAARWARSAAPAGSAMLTGGTELGLRPDIDIFARVREGGEVLGGLSVALAPGRDVAPPDVRLVNSLAAAASHLLRSTLLTAELAERVDTASRQARELRASRRRLVMARDIARDRLVHELAVSVQDPLGAVRERIAALHADARAAASGPERPPLAAGPALAVVSAAREQATAIIVRFRSVVHGIYPPALSEYGLRTAVEGLADALPRPTRITDRGLRRYPADIESAVYFCAAVALRALAAGEATVPLRLSLADSGSSLVLTVVDDARAGALRAGERRLLEELRDQAGAHDGAATAAEIGGQLWLQVKVPLQAAATRAVPVRPGPAPLPPDEAAAPVPAAGRDRGALAGRLFWAGFAGYSAFSAAWLALGLVSAIAANSLAAQQTVARLAGGGAPGWLADAAAGVLAGVPRSYPAGEVAFDYAFSAVNIAIAFVLLRLARRDWSIRLLAVGLIGSAAAFNLQAQSDIDALRRMTGLSLGWSHTLLLHGVGGVAYIFALLLFPAGRLAAGSRARRAGAALALGILAGAIALLSASTATISFVVFFGLLTPAAGIVAQWRHYRSAPTARARQQSSILLRALVLAFGSAILLSIGGIMIRAAQVPGFTVAAPSVVFWAFRAVFAIIPGALVAGILRFRLWDVERMFSRALIYGLLALLIGFLYVALVVGADIELDLPMRQNPLVQVGATAAVVLALAPAWTALSRLADRLAYGQRPPPAQVLARLSALSAATASGLEVLPVLARVAGDSLGARACEVRLAHPGGRPQVSSWHAGDPADRPPASPRPALVSARVVYRGDALGEIIVEPPAGGLAPDQRRLLDQLADAGGPALHNARLAVELEQRLAEICEQADGIAASRRRIAAAQAQERQALERNLHDAAQPALTAVSLALGLAAHRLTADAGGNGPVALAAALQCVLDRIDDSRTSLSEIARGLHPPRLREAGLRAALEARASVMPGAVTLEFRDDAGRARLAAEVEAAICFACLEGLQNAARHAPGAAIRLVLAQDGEALRFTISDTGPGFDPAAAPGFGRQNMADRIAAIDGRLEVVSRPGAGTTVSGWVPAAPAGAGAPAA